MATSTACGSTISTASPTPAAIAASSIAACRRRGRTRRRWSGSRRSWRPSNRCRTDWLVDGTTGYDFMDEASGVLHDPAGEAPLTTLWTESTGRSPHFEAEAREARRQILRDNLASELNATAAALKRVAGRDLVTRDFTLTALRRALVEVLVHFPIYRLYISTGGRSEDDKRILDWALAGARRTDPRRRPAADRPARRLARRRAAAQPGAEPAAGAALGRGAVPAALGPGRGEKRRGHRLLPLRPADLAQRGRLRPRPLRGDARPASTAPPRRGRRTSPAPCWRPRRMTTSAARMSAPGSRCCRRSRRNGRPRCIAGPG